MSIRKGRAFLLRLISQTLLLLNRQKLVDLPTHVNIGLWILTTNFTKITFVEERMSIMEAIS
jgi:hypothetical protein